MSNVNRNRQQAPNPKPSEELRQDAYGGVPFGTGQRPDPQCRTSGDIAHYRQHGHWPGEQPVQPVSPAQDAALEAARALREQVDATIADLRERGLLRSKG